MTLLPTDFANSKSCVLKITVPLNFLIELFKAVIDSRSRWLVGSSNINTLDLKDAYLLSSIFPNISIKDAEYILDNIPESGFDDVNNFFRNFPNLDFNLAHGNISVKSNIFELNSKVNFKDFESSSKSKIIYENNNNGFIISRIYNGI